MTTSAELRAKADQIDQAEAAKDKGTVYIYEVIGTAFVHQGTPDSVSSTKHARKATSIEVEALCRIPEFATFLASVRGQQ